MGGQFLFFFGNPKRVFVFFPDRARAGFGFTAIDTKIFEIFEFPCGDLEGGKRPRGYPGPEVDALEGLPGSELIYVRFTPESGHSGGSRKTSANDPKRTLWDHPAQAGFSNPANGILTLESSNNFPENCQF